MGTFTKLLCSLFFLSFNVWSEVVCSRVEFISNGYRDLIVSLPNNVPPQNRLRITDSLKELLDYSSRVLYVATKRRATFKSVILLVPDSWPSSGPWTFDVPIEKSNGGRISYRDADIVVIDDMQGRRPYTLQARGCGQRGVRIYLPTGFLLSDTNVEDRSIEFVHYWSQYRYGVFPEGGFPNDTLYPVYYGVPGTSEVFVTSCTNVPLTYNMTNKDGGICYPEVNYSTGRIHGEECQISPSIHSEVTSSLMYQQGLSRISQFCDSDWSLDKRHNPGIPSKHNALCSEEGTWFVILRNEDFLKGRNMASKYKPEDLEFRMVQEQNLRIVIAVDMSSEMGQKARHKLVRNAFTKFVLFDLPLGSELGTVYFAEDVKMTTQNLTLLTTYEEKSKFLETSPFYEDVSLSNETCIECGLLSSLELLRDESPRSGIIVLLLANPIGNLNVQDHSIQKALLENGIRVQVIQFSGTNNAIQTDVSFLQEETILSIPEMEESQSLGFLYMGLQSVLINAFSTSDDNNLVMVKKLVTSPAEISLTFHADQSVATDLTVLISGPTFQLTSSPLIEEATSLTSNEDQERFSLQKEGYIPAWQYNIPSAQPGLYTFTTKRKEGREDDVFISIFGKPSVNEDSITLRTWTDMGNRCVQPDVPVKIFAELRYGPNPIIGSEVSAVIYDPSNQETYNLLLLDNGLGDPDITKNDGIYSRYFTNYSAPGFYSLIVRAEGMLEQTKILYVSSTLYCCGSTMPFDKTEEIAIPFSRMSGFVSFCLDDGPKDSLDAFPPNRILDLAVSLVHMENLTYTLTWTSAGDDYDSGSADSYRVKFFSERAEARLRFNNSGFNLDSNREIIQQTPPAEYGTKQVYLVRLPEVMTTGYYFFAVKAVDDSNNYGAVSNIVQVYVENAKMNKNIMCEENGNTGVKTTSLANLHIILIVVLTYYNPWSSIV